jgi:hypothetical protein
LVTPSAGNGIRVHPFQVPVKAGQAYTFTVHARQSTVAKQPQFTLSVQFEEKLLDCSGLRANKAAFPLASDWQRFETRCVGKLNYTEVDARWAVIFMDTPGTSWVDLLGFSEASDKYVATMKVMDA